MDTGLYKYEAIVTHVVDGDTIDVDIDLGFDCWLKDQRIRFYGIDTPESRTRDLVEKKFGLLAKSIVEGYCPVGKKIILQTELDEKGKFGRILGIIWVDNMNLNDYLLENHYAVAYYGKSKEDIHAAHLANREFLIEHNMVTV